MSDYQNLSFRLVDAGLNLRDASDKVGEGKWIRLANVGTPQEALISLRKGTILFAEIQPGEGVHTIRRLDPSTLLVGVGDGVSTQSTSLILSGFSGDPISIIPFKPIGASETWGYLADSDLMAKVHSDNSAFQWGIDPPSIATTAIVSGSGGLDTVVSGAIAYDWKYTYYSSRTGAESNGSPESTIKLSGSGFAALVSATPSSDPQVDEIRFYRRGGVITNQWRLSGTAVNNPAFPTNTYLDNRADSAIATALPVPVNKYRPFPSVDASGQEALAVPLPYAVGPVLGKYILACGDPHRPGYLYWTNPEDPDTTSNINNVQITSPSEPLIAPIVYNGNPYVFTRDNGYAIDYGLQGVTFIGRKTSFGRGTVSPWGVAVGPEIFVVSQDGIYRTTGEDAGMSITEDSIRPIFHGYQVENFFPIDFSQPEFIRLFYAGQDLHFIYKDTNTAPPFTTGRLQHLVWSSIYERWHSSVENTLQIICVYNDENQSQSRIFSGSAAGNLYLESLVNSDAGTPFNVIAQTGYIDFGIPQTYKEFGGIIVDADPQGSTITLTPLLDGGTSSLPPLTITGSGRQKFSLPLPDAYAHNISLRFEMQPVLAQKPIVYQFDLLWRPDQEGLKHWEFPDTSHGLSGWQMGRDGYITVRSLGDLTLTCEIDGVSYPLTFRGSSNTGGERRKLYFNFPPVKGKLFRYSLDSGADFRLYGEDCEVRVKTWNTNLGYQLVSPFRAVGE